MLFCQTLTNLIRVCSSRFYTCADCWRDTSEEAQNYTCCSDHDGSSCVFTRKDSSGVDLGCGYEGDERNMSASQVYTYRARRKAMNMLTVQIALLLVCGIPMLFLPEKVAEYVLVSKQYVMDAGYDGYQTDAEQHALAQARLAEAQRRTSDIEEGGALRVLHSALDRLFGDGERQATKDEIQEAELAVQEVVSRKAAAIARSLPPQMIVSSMTRVVGAFCLGMAWISFRQRSDSILYMRKASSGYIMFYVCVFMGLLLSGFDSSSKSENSTFLMMGVFTCMTMGALWVVVQSQISDAIHRLPLPSSRSARKAAAATAASETNSSVVEIGGSSNDCSDDEDEINPELVHYNRLMSELNDGGGGAAY